MTAPHTPFHDLDDFVAIPRLSGLVLSPDGRRLVATVAQPTPDRDRYQTSLWEVDPAGCHDARRLTHSAQGETEPAFAGDGSLLFTSRRSGPDGDPAESAALWRLPATGEAVRVATSPGGISGPVGALASTMYVVATSRLAGADEQTDARWREDRDRAKVTAILHDGFPIRDWDHELGPDFPQLLVARTDDTTAPRAITASGPALTSAEYSITPDGSVVVTTWSVRDPHGRTHTGLVAIDVATGGRRTLVDEPGVNYADPRVAPDGRRVAAHRVVVGDYHTPSTTTVWLHDLADGTVRLFDLTEELSAAEFVWSPDGSTLYIAGDRHGRGAVVAVDVATGGYRRLASDAVYSSLSVSPDGSALYALRSAIDCPPQPVRLDTGVTDGAPTFLPSPAPRPELPGTLVEVEATTGDGATVHGWLVLPASVSGPAPLQQWIHGGPFGSFNSWSWRWCPWVAAARGWAVLMPDPALSTGYGRAWITRAWPHRAAVVWDDVAALLDSVLTRDDIDAERTACLGASFGGFMANWVAGHTDRFRAIVSHSGIWATDQQHATTDLAQWKTALFGTPSERPEWYAENSPHHFLDAVNTPMLVIHGNGDYRVPYSEGLRLFWDLVRTHQGDPATLPHRFLQFTGENHWVLTPANARIWHETVLAFLRWHVLGDSWTPPRLA